MGAKSASYRSLGIDVELYSGNVTFVARITRHKMSSDKVSELSTEFSYKFEFVFRMMRSFEMCSNQGCHLFRFLLKVSAFLLFFRFFA